MPTQDGKLILLTGHEGTGKCYWCGGELNGRRRCYCCQECCDNYYDTFCWRHAGNKALKRASNRCQTCRSSDCARTVPIEVHHIIPLNGGYRMWNVLNRQDNLKVLCVEHHLLADMERRREGKLLARGQLGLPLEVPRQRVQPVPVGQNGLW
jgi:hypothetical protein